MSRIVPLILVFAAALCFMAGYTVGKKQGMRTPPKAKPAAQIETTPADTVEIVTAPAAAPVEAPVPTATEPEPGSTPDAPDTAQLAQRAQQRFIKLTDTQDRSIQVEVLDVTESHLKVRRQSDFRIVQVPVSMLRAEDQAFAAYLWAEKRPAPMDKTDEQRILEELFGGF